MPRFSVIIPVHNRSALVRQTIDSVLAQTFADREIIVVNDASTDDTLDTLQTYGGEIRVITLPEQSGCEVARNAGEAVARGGYLAFLDSDDLLFPWALDTYDFVITATGQPAVLVSRFVSFSREPPAPMPGDLGGVIEIIVFQDYLSRDRTIASTASMIVVRQDVYGSVGGWRQSTASTFYGSDHDFLLRVGCHGPAVLLERPRAVAYRIHQGNSVRDIRRVVEGILRLIVTERNGSYPGGRKRRLDRRAVIGNQTYWWSRCAFLQRQPWLATRLVFAGFDMILARLVKRLRTTIRGLTPVTRLQRSEPAQPARLDRQTPMPRFSVIITCYNQRDFIKEAVDSILAQNCRDREIIVVDDGSTDGSPLVLEEYAAAITLVVLGTNQGADRARNRGAAIARGDFLVFLDGDDRLLPWALDVYGRVADLKSPKLILARLNFFKGSLPAETTGGHPEEIKVVDYEDYFKKSRTYRASASAMVVDRQTFHLVGGWTAGTFPADDQDLLLKLGCSGRALQIVSPETSAYRIHERNATRDVRPLVDSLHGLLGREKNGQYPGGRDRRFERRAVIGGFVFFMVKRTWQSRLPGEALKLLAAGWPMITAAILRKSMAVLVGRHPEETLAEISQPD